MEKKLAELYNNLANQIADMIPVEWKEVYYLGEVSPGRSGWSSVFYFKDAETNEMIRLHDAYESYGISDDDYRASLRVVWATLLEIYDCFIEYEQEPWEELSLYFNCDGEFKIEFFYDVNDGTRESLDRETVWAYNTFGLIPQDQYFRRILDRYLTNCEKNQTTEEKIAFLEKYGLTTTTDIHIFQPQEIKEIPLGVLPEQWYHIFAMEDVKKRITSMLDIWKQYSHQELRKTIGVLKRKVVNIELVRMDKRYFALYSIKYKNGKIRYYEGGNPLDTMKKNAALEKVWDKIPESIRCFYENVHDGFSDYAIKAMGLVWLERVTYFDNEDKWDIIKKLDKPLQINLHTTFGFFENSIGGYVAIDVSKNDGINEAILWFDHTKPEYDVNEYDINFWEEVDRRIAGELKD